MMVNLPCLMVSCTNFLRPTCSYTECQLSFQTGSLPYGENYCQLQLLFVFDFYWPSSYFKKTVFSGRSPLFHLLVLLGWSAFHTPSEFTGFLSRTLLGFRNLWTPARLWILIQSVVFMLPALTLDSVLQCLLTSYSDRILSPLLELCKSLSISYRLSL